MTTLKGYTSSFMFLIILSFVAFNIFVVWLIASNYQPSATKRSILQQTGQAISARYVNYRVIPNGSTTIPNRYEVEATWNDETTQQNYYFTSEPCRENPLNSFHEGQLMTVYIDPKNPKHYYFPLN